MADTGIFCSGDDVKKRAGKDANTDAISEEYLNYYIACAESLINDLCKYNFSDNYASLNDDTKKTLNRAAACRSAIDVINYDMDAFPNLRQAENMINVNRDAALNAESILSEKEVQDFILEDGGQPVQ